MYFFLKVRVQGILAEERQQRNNTFLINRFGCLVSLVSSFHVTNTRTHKNTRKLRQNEQSSDFAASIDADVVVGACKFLK